MVEIRIGTNEQGQRLDRFLRKYLTEAPLSFVYKIIRKDVKVNGKRRDNVYMLEEGDVVTLYLDEDEVEKLRGRGVSAGRNTPDEAFSHVKARKKFRIAYEDEEVLIADKPAGLLTHGDKTEKSNHLTNQVQGYLMEKGEYEPGREKTFAPSPVNRIDRNTSGLVIFAKNYEALKRLNECIRGRKRIKKIYLTIVCGRMDHEFTLSGMISKDESRNISEMQENGGSGSRTAVTYVKPVKYGTIKGMGSQLFTLAEVEIETGRTHQIRVQLADAGHPLIGDPKYGDRKVNSRFREKYSLSHQLLTAYRLEFSDMEDICPELSGKVVQAKLPKTFRQIADDIETKEKGQDISDE